MGKGYYKLYYIAIIHLLVKEKAVVKKKLEFLSKALQEKLLHEASSIHSRKLGPYKEKYAKTSLVLISFVP